MADINGQNGAGVGGWKRDRSTSWIVDRNKSAVGTLLDAVPSSSARPFTSKRWPFHRETLQREWIQSKPPAATLRFFSCLILQRSSVCLFARFCCSLLYDLYFCLFFHSFCSFEVKPFYLQLQLVGRQMFKE